MTPQIDRHLVGGTVQPTMFLATCEDGHDRVIRCCDGPHTWSYISHLISSASVALLVNCERFLWFATLSFQDGSYLHPCYSTCFPLRTDTSGAYQRRERPDLIGPGRNFSKPPRQVITKLLVATANSISGTLISFATVTCHIVRSRAAWHLPRMARRYQSVPRKQAVTVKD